MRKKIKKLFSNLKNPKVLKKAALVLLVVLVFAGYFYFQKTTDRVKIDNAQVETSIVNVVPKAPAQLKKLYVNDGDSVAKGDSLAQVGDEVLRSPIGGIVIKTDNALGDFVSPQTPVVQLIDPSQMRVVGTIDENKGLNKIKAGQTVSFTVDAYGGQTFWGFVDEVSQSAKQTQLSFSISSERPTQQFEVFANFDASTFPQIKNGMSAKMSVFTKIP